MDINLTSILENIGFDEKEAKVYLALSTIGQGTATEVSKQSGLKRAIVYHVLGRLKKRGYAQELPGGKIKQFSSSDPMKVLRNASAAAESLRIVMPMIQALQDKGREKPRIEFFEGKDAILSVYRTVYEPAKEARFLSSIERLNKFIPEETQAWVKRYQTGTIKNHGKHLLSDSLADRVWAKEAERGRGQEARILPKNVQMEMDFSIADDVLGITSFNPLFIVVIHSAGIASSAAQLFDLAWLQGRKI
jgi:sugar-specific transcriptional regulator TrmB